MGVGRGRRREWLAGGGWVGGVGVWVGGGANIDSQRMGQTGNREEANSFLPPSQPCQ